MIGGAWYLYDQSSMALHSESAEHNKQLEASIEFIGGIARLKQLIASEPHENSKVEESFKFAKESIPTQDEKFLKDFNRLKELNLKTKELKIRFRHQKAQVEQRWRELETVLDQQIMERMKKSQEFMPTFKKNLGRWSKNIPFLDKLRDSIDVSYVNHESFAEIAELIKLSRQMADLLIHSQGNESFDKKVKELIKELDQVKIPIKTKGSISGLLWRVVVEKKKLISLSQRLTSNALATNKVRSALNKTIDQVVIPKWERDSGEFYKNHWSKRVEQNQMYLLLFCGVGLLFILALSLIFLKIFPGLSRLESQAKSILTQETSKKITEIPNNEIGDVMLAFNNMLDDLESYLHTIKSKEQEKIKLQDALLRMKSINEMGEFSAKMAHELKNPLSILSFCLSDAKELIDNGQYHEVNSELEKCQSALKRLSLTASKLGAKRAYSKPETCNLYDLLADLVEMYQGLVQKENIEITLVKNNIENDPTVYVPRLELSGAVANLLDNGIEYYQHSQNIPKRAIELELSTDDKRVYLSIKNFSHKALESKGLFDLTSESKKGILRGLGLVIVKEVVVSSGGKIDYHYENHKSSFNIDLPLS
jgi:signal transduction histidine kinase